MDRETAGNSIRNYLRSSSCQPYLVCADGGEDYSFIKEQFSYLNLVRVSDYCNYDSLPDYDLLFDDISNLDKDTLLIGLGISDRLSKGYRLLGRITGLTLPVKLIVLCRGVFSRIEDIIAADPKFTRNRFCKLDSVYDVRIIRVSPEIDFEDALSIRSAVKELENGYIGDIYLSTSADVECDKNIDDAYSAVRRSIQGFSVPKEKLDDSMWMEYYRDNYLDDYPLTHWRTYLKYLKKSPENIYLKSVIEHSQDYKGYKSKLFVFILDIPYTDESFDAAYMSRKVLLRSFDDIDMLGFLAMSNKMGDDKIHYLTDNTDSEKEEIIREIVRTGIIPHDIDRIYPALSDYLYDYTFSKSDMNEISVYFSEYKRNKLYNVVPHEFMDTVIEYATDGRRIFNLFPAKNKLIESYDDGKTALCWIDALGLEYLGYIQKRALSIGMDLSIKVGQAVLPTLTKCNKDFYDTWKGKKLHDHKVDELDKIKHDGIKSNNAVDPLSAPIHITKELEIIDSELRFIKAELESGNSEAVLLTSDHGASRLAVISKHENMIEMNEPGKHSGRCCPVSYAEEKPEFAVKGYIESEKCAYWVLADYERFRGSRAANVEVHGGASLEEVLVPVILFTLANKDEKFTVILETPVVFYSPDTDPVVELFIPFEISDLIVKMEGIAYIGEEITRGKYKAVLSGCRKIKRTATIECYNGDNRIDSFDIEICSKSSRGMVSSDFDDLF